MLFNSLTLDMHAMYLEDTETATRMLLLTSAAGCTLALMRVLLAKEVSMSISVWPFKHKRHYFLHTREINCNVM